MLNYLDIQRIESELLDIFRTKTAQMYVNLSSTDLERVGDEVRAVLSQYEDNRHIQNKQYNPQTNEVEEVDDAE